MRVVGIWWLQPTPQWRSFTHADRHDFHEFILVVHGAYRVRRAGRIDGGAAGAAIHIPPGQEHTPELVLDGSLQYVVLQVRTQRALALPPQVDDHLGRLFSIATWMRSYGDHPNAPGRRALAHLAQVFIDEFARLGRSEHERDDQDLVTRATAYMTAGLGVNYGIADICAALDVSPSTLHRAFVARTGRPPMAHLKALRAETALHHLRESRLRLDTIAERVGLRHAASVSRLLKQVYGRNANQLRNDPTTTD